MFNCRVFFTIHLNHVDTLSNKPSRQKCLQTPQHPPDDISPTAAANLRGQFCRVFANASVTYRRMANLMLLK